MELLVETDALPGGTAAIMARIVDWDNVPVTQSAVESITYSARVKRSPPDQDALIDDHQDIEVPVANAVFDTLQTGKGWSADAIGWNFRHVFDVTKPLFGERGTVVRVLFWIVLADKPGQPIRFGCEFAVR